MFLYTYYSILPLSQPQDTVDVDKELGKLCISAPHLAVFQSVDSVSYAITVEGEAFVETDSLSSAFLYLFAAFYVFNKI